RVDSRFPVWFRLVRVKDFDSISSQAANPRYKSLSKSRSMDNGFVKRISGCARYYRFICFPYPPAAFLRSNHRANDLGLSFDFFPSSNPSTPKSSSKSSQWMPKPAPLISQWARSLGVPCARRGYQPMGTEIVRPSSRSTVSVSSVTVTLVALAVTRVGVTEIIPLLV